MVNGSLRMAVILVTDRLIIISAEMVLHMVEREIHHQRCRK